MFRRWWVVMLLSSMATVLLVTYQANSGTLEFGGRMFGHLDYSEETPHVRITLGRELTRPDQLFADSIRQAHLQLGEKRDSVDGFDETVIQKRLDRVSSVCSLLKKDNSSIAEIQYKMSYYNHSNILYCAVAKVASKFWSRMLHVMDTVDHISPFEFANAGHKLLHLHIAGMHESKRLKQAKAISDSAFKFVFTRNPYRRIYSSYLDKFLSPNAAYWNFGKKIVAFSRESPSQKSLQCGHDVTFSELVKYLIAHDPEKYDEHFKPVSIKCDVCRFNYDFIGKVETFKQDVMHILNITSTPKKEILIKDFVQENSLHYIIFNAKRAFGLKKGTLKCVSDHVIHLRLWRALQISGLIEKHLEYPLTPVGSRQANLTTIINLLLNAYHQSTSGARSNSKEAYLQAYNQVPVEDMEKLRLKYMKDFMLFDYDDRPDELFESRGLNSDSSFDYFDVLNLGFV